MHYTFTPLPTVNVWRIAVSGNWWKHVFFLKKKYLVLLGNVRRRGKRATKAIEVVLKHTPYINWTG